MNDKSNHEQDVQDFFEVTDQFISLANDLSDQWDIERVNATLMYASARYSAFVAHNSDAGLVNNKENAIKYFCEQFKEMFSENIDEVLSKK